MLHGGQLDVQGQPVHVLAGLRDILAQAGHHRPHRLERLRAGPRGLRRFAHQPDGVLDAVEQNLDGAARPGRRLSVMAHHEAVVVEVANGLHHHPDVLDQGVARPAQLLARRVHLRRLQARDRRQRRQVVTRRAQIAALERFVHAVQQVEPPVDMSQALHHRVMGLHRDHHRVHVLAQAAGGVEDPGLQVGAGLHAFLHRFEGLFQHGAFRGDPRAQSAGPFRIEAREAHQRVAQLAQLGEFDAELVLERLLHPLDLLVHRAEHFAGQPRRFNVKQRAHIRERLQRAEQFGFGREQTRHRRARAFGARAQAGRVEGEPLHKGERILEQLPHRADGVVSVVGARRQRHHPVAPLDDVVAVHRQPPQPFSKGQELPFRQRAFRFHFALAPLQALKPRAAHFAQIRAHRQALQGTQRSGGRADPAEQGPRQAKAGGRVRLSPARLSLG